MFPGNEEKPEVIYKIPCKNCEQVYVGETGRPLGARVKLHHKEVDSIRGSQIMFIMRIM